MTISIEAKLQLGKLHDLRSLFRSEFAGIPEKEAKLSAERIKRNIYKQSYGHVPLSRPYLKWKIKRGLDARILIATGAYVASIEARKQNATTWIVAPRAGTQHKGRALSTIGLWLEYGTRNMPARPHFRPDLQIVYQRLQQSGETSAKKIAKHGFVKQMVPK